MFCSQSLTVYNSDIKTHSNKEFVFCSNFLTISWQFSANDPLDARLEIVLLIIISALLSRDVGLPRPINAIPSSPWRNYEHKYKRYAFKDWTFIHISCYFFEIFVFFNEPHTWWRLSTSIFFFIGMIMDIVFSKGNRSVRFRINLTTISLLGNI